MNVNSLIKRKKELKMTYKELAEKCGIPERTIYYIFTGATRSPRVNTLRAIEKVLYGGGDNDDYPIQDRVDLGELYPIPLLGSVVAGIPIAAQEDLEGYIYINYRHNEEYFALRVHGDSMIGAGIRDKSVLVVHKQETAENGDIVVAMLNGEQTVKRYKVLDNGMIFLYPENHVFNPIAIMPDKDNLIILGKVVEIRITL